MDTDGFTVHVKTEYIYIFIQIQQILKQDLTLQILNQTDHYLKETIQKVIGLMKDELSGQIMKEFFGLGAKHIVI